MLDGALRGEILQQAAPLVSRGHLRGLQLSQVGVDHLESVAHFLLHLPGRVPGRSSVLLPTGGHFHSLGQVLSTSGVRLQGLGSVPGLFCLQPAAQSVESQLLLVLDEQQLSRFNHDEEVRDTN